MSWLVYVNDLCMSWLLNWGLNSFVCHGYSTLVYVMTTQLGNMTKQDAGRSPLQSASDPSSLVARVIKGYTLGLGPSICLGRGAPPNDDEMGDRSPSPDLLNAEIGPQ